MAVDRLAAQLRRTLPPLLQAAQAERGPLLVALSGGGDSLALLHLLLTTQLLPPERIIAAHFDHALRPTSADEAQWVMQHARQHGVTAFSERWASPPATGLGNLSEQARQARYDFLLRTARLQEAPAVLTAHQQEDQAETLLERLLRGSGLTGLGGMAASRPLGPGVILLRPLLDFRRQALRDWLQQRGLSWLEDPANRNPARRRARIRAQVLPLLEREAGHDLTPKLAQTAQRLQQAETALASYLALIWPTLGVEWQEREITLSSEALQAQPDALVCRVLGTCHQQLTHRPPLSAPAQAGFLKLVRSGRRQWTMRVQGLTVEQQAGKIHLRVRTDE